MIVKRPPHQTKLFFLGLLRTVSALATEPRMGHYGNAAAASVAAYPEITLRLARRADVPSLQRCNLATLPENYNQQFFANHMRQWPELTLVAECTDEHMNGHGHGGGQHNHAYSPFPTASPESNIVAYVLGKVEEKTVPVDARALQQQQYQQQQYQQHHHHTYHHHDEDLVFQSYTTERLGHVTSLAVLEPYRRQGLARELMEQLHAHMQDCYGADAVGLHVRRSNMAAERLYGNFGYEAAQIIPGYYQDGEDAYFMKKRLTQVARPPPPRGGLFAGFRKARPWETGPDDLQLPRPVGLAAGYVPPQRQPQPQQQRSGPEAAPGLWAGSM
jgi:ribosomal protein S18 acetylase RimI-like enzyme